MNYEVIVPPTREQGSYKTRVSSGGKWGTESIRAKALWDYNSARAHDGLAPISRMPAGTVYRAIVVYVVQGKYGGYGWEDVTAEDTKPEARKRLREYDENEPQYPHRIIRRAAE